MQCSRCGVINPPDSVLCDCGVRLDVLGYLPGKSKPSIPFLWSTIKNWKRLRQSRAEKAERVREINATFEHLGRLSMSSVDASSERTIDPIYPQALRDRTRPLPRQNLALRRQTEPPPPPQFHR